MGEIPVNGFRLFTGFMHLHSRSKLQVYYFSALNKIKYDTVIWIKNTFSHYILNIYIYIYNALAWCTNLWFYSYLLNPAAVLHLTHTVFNRLWTLINKVIYLQGCICIATQPKAINYANNSEVAAASTAAKLFPDTAAFRDQVHEP